MVSVKVFRCPVGSQKTPCPSKSFCPPTSSEWLKKDGGLEEAAENQTTMPSSGKIVTPYLKPFKLSGLRAATDNFKTELGEGGFGKVFKGWVDERTYAQSKVGVGMAVSVKKSTPDSQQGLKEWQVCLGA